MSDAAPFDYLDDPAHPGWKRWELKDGTRFNAFLGPLRVRLDEPRTARVRMTPERRHSNLSDNVHGGTLLGFIDVALFAAARSFGLEGVGMAVTLDLSTQFVGSGDMTRPLDAVVELLRETRRLMFMRGLVMQDDDVVASFAGTIRKFEAAGAAR